MVPEVLGKEGRFGASVSEALMAAYTVRNKDGNYFGAKGYGGCGDTLVQLLNNGRAQVAVNLKEPA